MAIICSDDFAGLGTSTLSGRTLNNALGGSGTRTWENAGVNLLGDGSGALDMNSTGARGMVNLGTQPAFRAGALVTQNGNGSHNLRVTGRLDVLSESSHNCVHALLVSGNSLRIREQVAGANNDRATKSVTQINSGLWYQIWLEMNGLVWKAELRDAGGALIDSVSYTASSGPSGPYYGFGSYLSATGSKFDDWIFETIDTPPPSSVRPRGGFIL